MQIPIIKKKAGHIVSDCVVIQCNVNTNTIFRSTISLKMRFLSDVNDRQLVLCVEGYGTL